MLGFVLSLFEGVRSAKSSSIRSSRDSKLFDLFNSVYSALISLLALSGKHIKHLLSRGLSREEVRLLERRGYSKDALERAGIAIRIAKDFGGDISYYTIPTPELQSSSSPRLFAFLPLHLSRRATTNGKQEVRREAYQQQSRRVINEYGTA